MAGKLLCCRTQNVASVVFPAVRRNAVVRLFSNYDERQSSSEFIDFEASTTIGSDSFRWPETKLGPLEPKDRRFPFPGIVGSIQLTQKTANRFPKQPPMRAYNADLLVAELPYKRQSTVLEQFITVNKEVPMNVVNNDKSTVNVSPFDVLECFAHDCPFFLRQDFSELFPGSSVHGNENLTVITLCQRERASAKNWMSDNKTVLSHFVKAATDICEMLHTAGFWADFTDPTSGRPYLGLQTTATAFEVDERYRRFGFEIDESPRNCRLLRHHELGSRPFVGCIFTSAPLYHPLVVELAVGKTNKS